MATLVVTRVVTLVATRVATLVDMVAILRCRTVDTPTGLHDLDTINEYRSA